MKRKRPFVTNAQLSVLEEFDARHRAIAQNELPAHTNASILLSRMVRHGWLKVTGYEQSPNNGSRTRVVAITALGRLAREYGRTERKRGRA